MHIFSNSDLSKEQLASAIAQLSLPGAELNDLPADDPRKQTAALNSGVFTILVDQLRKSFPDEEIRMLCSDLWNLCNNQIMPVVMLEPGILTTITLLGMGKKVDGKVVMTSASIGLPDNYYQMALENSTLQMGGIVYIASQARDFWNKKTADPMMVQKRAKAYEVTYILETQKLMPEYVCNEYQKSCIETTPNGIKDIMELLYESQPTPPEDSYLGEKPNFNR